MSENQENSVIIKQKPSVFWKKLLLDGGLLVASFGIVHMIKHGVEALDP